MRYLKLVLTACAVTLWSGLASADLLWTQPVHAPGATGGNGLSAFQGTLGANQFDREVADDFSTGGETWLVDTVRTHWVKFDPNDPNPITGGTVQFFQRTGAGGVGALVATATSLSISQAAGPGTYFGRPEIILTATFDPILLGPGDYFMHFQPNVDHNWFWLTHDVYANSNILSFVHIQRGPNNNGTDAGWPASWASGSTVFGNDFDISFHIEGTRVVIPEPTASVLLLGAALGLIGYRRRK